jgi:competence protein ComGC
VVFLACWQAVKARHLSIEFSESTYIGLSLFSMAQFLLTGLPVVAVVRDTPQAFYMVLSFVIFLLCMVVLLLIFLPKMSMQRQYAGLSESDQRKMINMALAANRKTASNFGQSDGSYKSSTDSVPMAQNGSSQCMPQSQEKTAACSAPLHDAPSPAGESHLHRHINTSTSTSGSKTVSIREDPEESGSSNNSPTVEIQSTTHPGQSSDATLLFQNMLQMSSTTCSSEEAFETFLRLLDRSKLSASELSILDRLLRSIQEGPAA